MAKEIERKFLIRGETWRSLARGISCRQGYLSTAKECTVRVRIIGGEGFLTIKGVTIGAARAEYEYGIPASEADEMLTSLCEKPLIEKNRYKIAAGRMIWEIDEFTGENQGLIVAEIELENETQKIDLPEWIGQEVTGDPKYYNSSLTRNPFTRWGKG